MVYKNRQPVGEEIGKKMKKQNTGIKAEAEAANKCTVVYVDGYDMCTEEAAQRSSLEEMLKRIGRRINSKDKCYRKRKNKIYHNEQMKRGKLPENDDGTGWFRDEDRGKHIRGEVVKAGWSVIALHCFGICSIRKCANGKIIDTRKSMHFLMGGASRRVMLKKKRRVVR